MWRNLETGGTGRALVSVLCVIGLAGCADFSSRDRPGGQEYPVDPEIARHTGDPYSGHHESRGSLFGELSTSTDFKLPGWLGGSDEEETQTAAVGPGGTGIQVNGYLWGAALDTVSFMPLERADPQGGIIQTGWYSEPDRPDERHRVNVFIVSGQLRSDGVRVAVFRQIRNEAGEWVDGEPLPETGDALKNVIMQRARELGTTSTG